MGTLLGIQESAVGFDVSISELILTESFLKTFYPDRNVFLFAGVTEYMPLKSNLFTLVMARDVIEHVGNQKEFLLEAHRVLNKNSYFLFNTGSRYVFIEPHTRLPGVGYLPRFLQPLYVRLIRNRTYEIRLPSLWELRRWLRKSRFGKNWKIFPSRNLDSAMKFTQERNKIAHLMLKILNILRLSKLLNRILAHISYYEIITKK